MLLPGSGRTRRRQGEQDAIKKHEEALNELGRAAGNRASAPGRQGALPGGAPDDPGSRGPGAEPRWVAPPPPPPAPSTYAEMREAGAEPTVTLGDYEPPGVASAGTGGEPPGRFVTPGYRTGERSRMRAFVTGSGLAPRERSLRWLTLLAAVAVLAVAATLATTGGTPVSTHSATRPSQTKPGTGGSAATSPSGAASPSSTATPPASSSTTPPASTTTTAAANGKPAVAAITPAAGAAGQTVNLSGSGFFSSNGVITVTFGGTQARVSCPSQTSCVVTVPADPSASPSAPVPVKVTTTAGTSAPVQFSYQ